MQRLLNLALQLADKLLDPLVSLPQSERELVCLRLEVRVPLTKLSELFLEVGNLLVLLFGLEQFALVGGEDQTEFLGWVLRQHLRVELVLICQLVALVDLNVPMLVSHLLSGYVNVRVVVFICECGCVNLSNLESLCRCGDTFDW